MQQPVRYQLWIVAAGVVIFFTNLGAAALWDMDEALYTTCAREMLGRNDWVVPWFNGQMFPEKPPLMFWQMIAGFELFGVNEFGARFFSAVFGVVTAIVVFHLGRILFNIRVGLWAGLITASTIIFTISARAATVDSALTLVTAAAFLAFVIARNNLPSPASGRGAGGEGGQNLPGPENPSASWLPAALMYACIGIAVLAKGPVGMLLPLAAMGLYLLVANGWRNVFRSAWQMRPLMAIIVIAAVALPWYVMVGIRTDGEWLRKFFIEFNLRPFKQPILSHGDVSMFSSALAVLVSILYYFYQVPAVLVGFFPWSVFLGPTLADVTQRIRRRDPWRDGCLLAVCWFAAWFVFWSICKTKLPHYLLPAYPALALLTACFIDRWLSEPASLKPWWLRNAWISMILVGLGITIAVPIVASIYLPGDFVLGLIGLVPLVCGCWCWRQTARGRNQSAAIGFSICAVVFLTAMFGWGAVRVDRHQNSPSMMAAIRADWGKTSPAPIATYYFFRESMVYYAGHPITRCEDDPQTNRSARQELEALLAKSPRAYVITTNDNEALLKKDFPGRFDVLLRQHRFLAPANDELVVLVSNQKPTTEY